MRTDEAVAYQLVIWSIAPDSKTVAVSLSRHSG